MVGDWGNAMGEILLRDVISMVVVPTPSLDERPGAYPRTKPKEHMRERWPGGMRKSSLERVGI